ESVGAGPGEERGLGPRKHPNDPGTDGLRNGRRRGSRVPRVTRDAACDDVPLSQAPQRLPRSLLDEAAAHAEIGACSRARVTEFDVVAGSRLEGDVAIDDLSIPPRCEIATAHAEGDFAEDKPPRTRQRDLH